MNSAPHSAIGADANQYLQLWAAAVAEVLGQIAGSPCPVDCAAEPPAGAQPESADDLHLLIVSTGALRGEMHVRMGPDAARTLGRRMLGEETDPGTIQTQAAIASDEREAVLELFRQVAGRAATAISSINGDVQLRVEAGSPPSWAAAANAWMRAAPDTPSDLLFEWKLSAALAAELAARKAQVNAATAVGEMLSPVAVSNAAAAPSLSADADPSRPAASSMEPARLELFKDVELDVTLRFGGKRMLLREILDLGPGSVVELDRQVQEPVELLLDGRVIALGEVVVVEGNYGLRVLSVPGTQQAVF